MSMPDRMGIVVLAVACWVLFAPLECRADAVPETARKVVFAKSGTGYRWAVVDAPVGMPGANQVLVRVRAVSLNRADVEMLEIAGTVDRSGRTIASDAAGEVVAVGTAVRGLSVGTRVISTYFRNWTDGPPTALRLRDAHGESVDGVFAEYAVLEETAVAPAPAYLSDVEASTLPTAGTTAWNALMGRRPLEASDVVLVQGTGGVSIFGLQIARAAGARVIVTSSSDAKLARAKALGATDGINYRATPQWGAAALKLTDGHGADVIIEVGGKGTVSESMQALAQFGTLSIVGGLSGYGGEIPAVSLLAKTATARGIFVGSRADLEAFASFMARHRIRPVVDRVFPLAELDAARAYMLETNFVGKIVVTL